MRMVWLEDYRRVIYLLMLGAGLSALAGLTRLQTEANYRVYFDSDDELLALEQSINERFALSDSAVLVLRAGAMPLLSNAALGAFARMESELAALPFVSSVRGFYQFANEAQDVAFGDVAPESEDPFAEIASGGQLDDSPEGRWQRLMMHPRARNLVSSDGRFALIEVRVAFVPGDSARQVLQAMTQIRELGGQLLVDEGVVSGVSYSGVLALNHAYISVVRHDLRVFIPGLLVLMALVLFAVFRQWRLVLLPLGGGLVAALMAMGVAGWAGWTLAAINAFTPIIIVSLHLAASMHLIVGYLQQCAPAPVVVDNQLGDAVMPPVQAMQRSLDFNLSAMTLSALTTAAGFLLLSLSPSPPIRVVGYCAALGVSFSYLLNVVLLPLILPRLQLQPALVQRCLSRWDAQALVRWLQTHTVAVIAVAGLLSVLATLSLSRLQINDSVYDYFPSDNSFTQGTRQLDSWFDGCVRLSYVLDGTAPGTVLNAQFQAVQLAFADWLQRQPEVGGVREVFGLMRTLGIDLPQAERIVQQRSVRELGLDGEVNAQLSSTRIDVVLRALTSRELIAFNQRARQWLAEHSGAIDYQGGSGADLIFAWLGQRNASSMFISLGLALAAIGVLVGVLFRDIGLAALGLLCNLLPLVLVYALWFASGAYISLGAAVVLGMIMGVIVDDTLHLLCKYRRIQRQGSTMPVIELGRQVLPAVLITSITLMAGLSIGLLSDFRPLRELSLLSAGVILAALLVDALLLPAVLMLRERNA
jgi:predicted RND superfamily exporter protein